MSDNSFLIQTTSRATADAAMYSTSVVISVTSLCRCDGHVTAPFVRQKTYPYRKYMLSTFAFLYLRRSQHPRNRYRRFDIQYLNHSCLLDTWIFSLPLANVTSRARSNTCLLHLLRTRCLASIRPLGRPGTPLELFSTTGASAACGSAGTLTVFASAILNFPNIFCVYTRSDEPSVYLSLYPFRFATRQKHLSLQPLF